MFVAVPSNAGASFEVATVDSDRVAALRYANTTGYRIRTAYLRIANRLPPVGGISLHSRVPDLAAVDRFEEASDAFIAAKLTEDTIAQATPRELAILADYLRELNAAERQVLGEDHTASTGERSTDGAGGSGASLQDAKLASEACFRDYTPYHGQEGKDIFWLPTADERVQRMLELADTTARDHVVDLGSGDGRIPIAAARDFGATSRGIEFDGGLVTLARCLSTAAGVEAKTSMVADDVFKADFSDATVITMYLGDEVNVCLRHRLLALRPGTRIVSHQFVMGDWRADKAVDPQSGRAGIYLWHVPARVGGTWDLSAADGTAFSVRLTQTFQEVFGRASFGEIRQSLNSARLDGNHLVFVTRDPQGEQKTFIGTVQGDRLEGILRDASGDTEISGHLRVATSASAWAEPAKGCEAFYRRD